MVDKSEIMEWFKNGSDDAKNLIDLKWNAVDTGNYVILQSDKIPFALFMSSNNDGTISLIVRTGIETATIDNNERLKIYRILLILNRRVELVKFMLDGINEEVVSRVDFTDQNLTKDVMNIGLNTILSAFYLMVQALNLQEEFNEQIIERMAMLIKSMFENGKSRDEIKEYLVKTTGIRDEDAERLISEVLDSNKPPSSMYQ
ncbi:hypothetical protein [Picrophilus oshimae]|uniref:Uncharacterized protein n=1 Tax=Picrophilus torridus (strain ATCC 700027 / DSM 9790 / JCM 10055 / NBRC 100828 / KAW 2/3) TaxID=1122961 RepID=A0A8G2FWU3_PICTO|nr:hypothetical protein [Picrophilus oshimae]SMD30924.1 hypothetical protein SAMN02745355_0842 [Picrophilus oshimae DSM 9789]